MGLATNDPFRNPGRPGVREGEVDANGVGDAALVIKVVGNEGLIKDALLVRELKDERVVADAACVLENEMVACLWQFLVECRDVAWELLGFVCEALFSLTLEPFLVGLSGRHVRRRSTHKEMIRDRLPGLLTVFFSMCDQVAWQSLVAYGILFFRAYRLARTLRYRLDRLAREMRRWHRIQRPVALKEKQD
jgi:hypothetical protein